MKVFCCYTPAHNVLFEKYFRPSIPHGLTLEAIQIDISGAGDFLSKEFLRCIRKKILLIQESIEANRESIIIWSDVDIAFFASPERDLEEVFQERSELQVLFQREGRRIPDVNTGFMALRCTEDLARYFEKISHRLEKHGELNEQAVINQNLHEGLKWDYLPWTYYARTQGWPPPRDLVIYHANYTKGRDGVGQKIRQLDEIQRIQKNGWPAYFWAYVRHGLAKALRRN
ncbi:nucleotide-diphospho-sugar transferase [Terrimicrobium sacchariphilum]|uniref:Nucleotide-diphospho-sugar transferase n=1 Tax=Terrimicrobium sacchariphilum TaxID=690879 RepID=A0A146G284_TERSA|nr:putative nucleotide-diphospho-sugar transferase [Terrimicrobium sacchariphilum]GAT31750.1 nucleotide-diphospho-sugar transferase [Terrimicrobium sacchariphilum]